MRRVAVVVVALVGVGVGAWLLGSGSEAPEPVTAAAAETDVDGDQVPVRASSELQVRPKDLASGPPQPPRRGTHEPTEEELAAAPFVSFSSKAAPRWQGVSRELRRLGHDALADASWEMAQTLRELRRDPEREDQAVLEAQHALLEQVLAVPDLDPPAAEAVASVKDVIGVYDRAVER